jgi:rhamnogalacturonyl hydrolase YesR
MNEPYPGREGNYFESSAAAMFTYGWLAGLREGWLNEAQYAGPTTKAYKHLIEDFVTENANGTLTWEGTVEVGSLGSNATFEVSFLFRRQLLMRSYYLAVFRSLLYESLLMCSRYSTTPASLPSSTTPAALRRSFSLLLSGR